MEKNTTFFGGLDKKLYLCRVLHPFRISHGANEKIMFN